MLFYKMKDSEICAVGKGILNSDEA